MNLGQFHDRIKAALKRGTAMDAMIPLWVADAANLLELNYTFSWMRKVSNQTILAGANSFAAPAGLKSLIFMQHVLYADSGMETYGRKLLGVEPEQVIAIGSGYPVGFWLEGSLVKVDAITATDEIYRVGYNQFTTWPTDLSATPPLLAKGQAVLTAQTLAMYAMEQKDDRMQQLYEQRLELAVGMLLRAEEELRMQHQGDLQMQYSGFTR